LVESPGNPAINIYFIQLINIMPVHLLIWSVVTWWQTNGDCHMRRTRHALCMRKCRNWFKILVHKPQRKCSIDSTCVVIWDHHTPRH
jgi:hypothetical protein